MLSSHGLIILCSHSGLVCERVYGRVNIEPEGCSGLVTGMSHSTQLLG
nr:MAG TPA: retinol-binding protein [Caudoviricetes sp.]